MDYEIRFKPDGTEYLRKFQPVVLSNAHVFCALVHEDAGKFKFLIRRFVFRACPYHGSAWDPGASVTVHCADLLGNEEKYEMDFNAYDFQQPVLIAPRLAQDLSRLLPEFFQRTWSELEKAHAEHARLAKK